MTKAISRKATNVYMISESILNLFALPLGLAANLVQDDIRDGMAGFIGKIQPFRGLFHLFQIMFQLRLGVCQVIVHIGGQVFNMPS